MKTMVYTNVGFDFGRFVSSHRIRLAFIVPNNISTNSEDCAAMKSLYCHWILCAAEHGSYKVATKSDKKKKEKAT